MLSRNCAFVGVLLLISTQVQGIEYLEDVIARAEENFASYNSGKDIGKPVFDSEGVVLTIGNLNNETFPLLSEDQKIAINGVYKILEKAFKANKKSYDQILAKMLQTQVLKPEEDYSLIRKDKSISRSTKVNELNDWFSSQVINNPDFLVETDLDVGSCISMGRATKLIFSYLKNACSSNGGKRDIIDLAVLEYPQQKSGNFALHRVRVSSWTDCSAASGIIGRYSKRTFMPRTSVLSRVDEDVRKRALAQIEEVYDKIGPKPKKVTHVCMPITTSSSTCFSGNSSTVLIAALLTIAIIMKVPSDDDEEDEDVCQ